MVRELDAIVIGAGQAGPSLAVRLAKAGNKTVLIERRALGGTCVNDGCIPTKTLVASARAAWVARNAGQFGIDVGNVAVDMRRVKQRKDEVVNESRGDLGTWIDATEGLELVIGHGVFEGPRVVRVGEDRFEAPMIFVNVGARATIPDIAGLREGPFLTNHTMMDIDALPEHLVILGGSYIALEFAQMYRRFGSRVSVIERAGRLIAREDEDVSAEIRRFLELEGVAVHLSTKVERIDRAGGGIAVVTEHGRIDGTALLIATGRTPNTADLGLAEAGIAVDARGYIRVDDELRTNVPGVWALGDCNGRGAFTHTSYNDHEILAENLLDGGRRRVSDRIPIYGLYVDPPLGRVGMNEAQARASGRPVLVGKRPMTRVGRARERGETNGFIKIMVDRETQQILGAAILGIEGDEAIHAIADVMYAKAPYTVISRAVHAHPTVSELLPTTLQDLAPLA